MSRPIFMVEDPWVNVNPKMRRTLSQLRYESPYVTKVFEICQRLGLQPERPICRGLAAAHIGIPRRRVAIYFLNFMETERITKTRDAWKREGWKMMAVQIKDITATSSEDLSIQLAAALKGIGK